MANNIVTNKKSNLGIFNSAAPGNVGIVKMKCEIYANKPISKRPFQDVSLVFSPDTIVSIPENIRKRLFSVSETDGIFLRPIFKLRSNFVGVMKRAEEREENLDKSFKESILKFRKQEQSNIEQLSSSGGPDDGDSPDYNGILDEEIDIIPLAGSDLQDPITNTLYDTENAAFPHYTWILDGSLFINDVFDVEEHVNGSNRSDPRSQFFPIFRYTTEPLPVDLTDSDDLGELLPLMAFPVQSRSNGSISPVNIPEIGPFNRQSTPNIVDPLGTANMYEGVNPGIHWSVIKRTPVFQGADFFVSFRRLQQSLRDLPDHKDAIFLMRKRFEPLDINIHDENVVESVPTTAVRLNDGVVETGSDGKIIEESKEAYDFARQAYYIVEIGVLDPDHNYFIVITENSFPSLIHVGIFPVLLNKEIGTDAGGNSVVTKKVPVIPRDNVSRRLSVYKAVTGRQLIQQENLTISVRNHLGSLIINFSEHDDPWIIRRADIVIPEDDDGTPERDNKSNSDTVSRTDEFNVVRVPMIVPEAQLGLHAGNVKCGFMFNFIKYEKESKFTFPQTINVKGPLDDGDINIFLRDTGYSYNPEVSSRNIESESLVKTGFASKAKIPVNGINYSHDAHIFEETINGEGVPIPAYSVQREQIESYGKAPDLFTKGPIVPLLLNGSSREFKFSRISVLSNNDLKGIGSSGGFAQNFTFEMGLESGDYIFDEINGKFFILRQCITPIALGCRIVIEEFGTSYTASTIDVAHHVTAFSENWSARDFTSIEHSGNISFLMNENMVFEDGNNQTEFLASLVDKTFYLQVSAWWDNGIMPKPEKEIDRIVITGMCRGGSVEISNNKRIMSCDIVDYMQILKDQIFLNSPFFDKMRDFNAIHEVLKLAGFRDDDDLQPASLMKRLAFFDGDGGWSTIVHNGDTIDFNDYALPGSYDIIQQPFLRFKDGDQLNSAIDKIATLSGKMAYFDRLGVFHLDNLPDERIFFLADDLDEDTIIQNPLDLSIIDVFASPLDGVNTTATTEDLFLGSDIINNSDVTNSSFLDLPSPTEDTSTDKDVECPVDLHRQVFNAYTYKRLVEDVVNEIKVISTTPDGELLIAGHVNFESIFEHDTPGFLGYPKTFLQMDGIFGSEDAVKKVVKHYTKMFTPPITVSFEMFGHNKLKALDIITFQFLGRRDKQPLRINQLTSTIDPAKNSWMQKLECDWIFPSRAIDWGPSANEDQV